MQVGVVARLHSADQGFQPGFVPHRAAVERVHLVVKNYQGEVVVGVE